MEVKASLNYLHMAPRKVRLIAAAVRGLDADRALGILDAMRRRASGPVSKLLRSALADAAHNFQAGATRFYVKEIRVDEGPAAKRFRARAFGRAAAIRRKTSHVSVVLGTRHAASAPSAPGPARAPAPAVHEADAADVRHGFQPPRPRGRGDAGVMRGLPSKPNRRLNRGQNFIRRVFRRKAI